MTIDYGLNSYYIIHNKKESLIIFVYIYLFGSGISTSSTDCSHLSRFSSPSIITIEYNGLLFVICQRSAIEYWPIVIASIRFYQGEKFRPDEIANFIKLYILSFSDNL